MEIDNIKITDDGSHTLFVPELNEHYHSTNGAIQESKHVFIDAGFKHIMEEKIHKGILNKDNETNCNIDNKAKHNLQTINILEIGYGTGLNALLTLVESKKMHLSSSNTDKHKSDTRRIDSHPINIFYHTLELYPLSIEKSNNLNYPELLSTQYSIDYNETSETFQLLHSSTWEIPVEITPEFTLLKQKIDFSDSAQFSSNRHYDLIYFDAFAPEKQPEMWTERVFTKIYSLCNTNAALTTYCAKGVIRRLLQDIGFQMERLAGPPGKREILRGTKI